MVNPVIRPEHIDAKTAQSKILLDAGRNRLTTTQAALVATQDTYQKSMELVTQQQTRFLELNAYVAGLKSANMTLVSSPSVDLSLKIRLTPLRSPRSMLSLCNASRSS